MYYLIDPEEYPYLRERISNWRYFWLCKAIRILYTKRREDIKDTINSRGNRRTSESMLFVDDLTSTNIISVVSTPPPSSLVQDRHKPIHHGHPTQGHATDGIWDHNTSHSHDSLPYEYGHDSTHDYGFDDSSGWD